jgi:hypothetical protein
LVMQQVEKLLDGSIATEGYFIPELDGDGHLIDLSGVDFDALAEKFKRTMLSSKRIKGQSTPHL